MRWSSASLLLVLVAACSEPPAGVSGEVIDAGPAADAGALSCDALEPSCPPGDGCYWAGSPGAFVCAETLGLPVYHPCQASDQCAAGLGCHLDDFFSFYCTAYCDYATNGGASDPRCQEHELCAGPFDGDVGICLGICDALDSDCPDGLGCYHILEAADLCLPVTAEGATGDECLRNNDCSPGRGCVDVDGTSACAVYCDHDANPESADPRCDEGEVCAALGDGERIGACRAP